MYQKVIKIRGEDSPNVRAAFLEMGLPPDWLVLKPLLEQADWMLRGPDVALDMLASINAIKKVPSGRTLIPNVLTWDEYLQRRREWDPIRQCVGLDAAWYKGDEVFLFPHELMLKARARGIKRAEVGTGRVVQRRAMGVDPAEGGDRSSWVIGDRLGALKLVTLKTPNTEVIIFKTRELMKDWGIDAEDVVFDRGGGGYQFACRLKAMGVPVRTVTFNEVIQTDLKRGMTGFQEKVEVREDKSLYKNRRVEMYWEAAALFDPIPNPDGYAMPPEVFDFKLPGRKSLCEQLEKIPREYDDGRPFLRPKSRKPGQEDSKNKLKTLIELIGHSPDEADAFVLMCHGLFHKPTRHKAGAT